MPIKYPNMLKTIRVYFGGVIGSFLFLGSNQEIDNERRRNSVEGEKEKERKENKERKRERKGMRKRKEMRKKKRKGRKERK